MPLIAGKQFAFLEAALGVTGALAVFVSGAAGVMGMLVVGEVICASRSTSRSAGCRGERTTGVGGGCRFCWTWIPSINPISPSFRGRGPASCRCSEPDGDVM
jgi:hypothetical protein